MTARCPLPQALIVGVVLLVGGCRSEPGAQSQWVEPPTPAIMIPAPDSVIARTRTIRPLPAGPLAISFAAIVRADPDHYAPVVASPSEGGTALRVTDAGQVRAGDTLLLVRSGAGDSLRVLVAHRYGAWWPRLRTNGHVEPGDTVGILQHEGRFIADGRVEGRDATILGIGDSALLVVPGPKPTPPLRGRIEAALGSTYGTDVSVHFHGQDRGIRPNDLVSVTIFAESPSLKRVPASAVFGLSWGSAVLVPVAGSGFVVRFVDSDTHGSGGRVIHSGLIDESPIVEAPTPQLIAAVETALAAWRSRPANKK